MTRPFTKLMPAIFEDKRFRSLGWEGKAVFFYILGGKHQNSAGCYKLPAMYAASDMKCSIEEFARARQSVADAGLILFDADTDEVYLVGWFDDNPITNRKHAEGTRKFVLQIESDTIRESVEEDFLASTEAFQSRKTEFPPDDPKIATFGPSERLLSTGLMNRAR